MNQTIRNNKQDMAISLMNHKDEEKLLSESLYRNLHVLQRFHNPLPDFLTIYDEHMFIKSNPRAFFHVSQFLFICLDAAEFNKRFLWPLYDKASEARYRNSFLDYVNHLNTIYQLGFETLRMHNIHIPGGLKFIKIIHKLSVLVMKVTLRKHTGITNMNDIPNANEQLAKLEESVDSGLDFVTRLQAQSNILNERIDKMNSMMVSLFEGSTMNVTPEQCWSCLAKQWHDQLDNVVETDVKPKLERVGILSKSCVDLEKLLTKLFVDGEQNTIDYDKAKLVVAQNVLMKWNPDMQQAIIGMVQNNFINFDNLLQVFRYLLPRIMEKIEKFDFRSLEALQYECDTIDNLNERASHVQVQIIDFEKKLQPFLKLEEERFRAFCTNIPNHPFNVWHTPIISRKYDSMRKRIALMDDSHHSQVKLFNETLPYKSLRTINKDNSLNCTISEAHSSLKQSNRTRNDAMQILKKPKDSKFKLNATTMSNMSCLSRISPKFSSTMCSTAVKSHENKNHQNDTKISLAFANLKKPRTMSENIVEENSFFLSPNTAVTRKFSTNSVFHLNQPNALSLRGSPTHRWEVNDKIFDVHRNLFTHPPLNGNHQENAEVQIQNDVENVIAALNEIHIDVEESLWDTSAGLLNDVSKTD